MITIVYKYLKRNSCCKQNATYHISTKLTNHDPAARTKMEEQIWDKVISTKLTNHDPAARTKMEEQIWDKVKMRVEN